MNRNVCHWSLLTVLLVALPVLAGPSDLLKQAVEENNPAVPVTGEDVQAIVSKADRFLEQREFDKAIGLYERAYRLAPMEQSNYIRLLVAKQAAGRMTEPEHEALDLIRQEESARIDQTFRIVRLDILQARQALRAADTALATAKLDHARSALDGLPTFVDAAPYRRQLTNLRKATAKKAGKVKTPAPKVEDAVDSDVLTLMEGADEGEPSPDGRIIDVEDLLADSHALHRYDRELADARRRNRVDWLLSNNEAAIAPLGDMTFPDDWPERTARRARYRDGVIYESPPYKGEDGKTYTTAIYDLGDLVHPVPNFYATYPGTARMQRMQMLDRHALRWRSQIFNGYAEDLAAGMPLLHFFGGIDNNAISTRTDPRETERIMRMLKRFVDDQ